MKFKTTKLKGKQKRRTKFAQKDFDIAMKFAERVNKELAGIVSAVVLFGSSAEKKIKARPHDLDVLVILDDIRLIMTTEIVQTYRIIIEKIISEVGKDRLHVQVLHLKAWWGYVRAGDPVALNILRDGYSLIDTGFFDPLQALLDEGKIRPSEEAVWTYLNMSEAALFRAENHIINAVMEMYWSVIDSAHAALMSAGELPKNPKHVADMLRQVFVKKGKLSEKEAKTMEMFYKLSKEIVYKRLKKVTPSEYTQYEKLAHNFVEKMKKIVEANVK